MAVEGGDDPIAISVHLRNRVIRVVARGVRIADDIEPMPAPALSASG